MMESMVKQIFEHVQIIQQENIVFDDGLVTEAPPSVLCGKLHCRMETPKTPKIDSNRGATYAIGELVACV